MKRILLTVTVLLMRMVYAPLRALMPLKRRVTIISRQSDQPSVDIRMLADYLRLRYPRMECRVLTRSIHDGIGGKLAYIPHMIGQMVSIASSRAVVLDGYCITACVLRHKPETRIIQMWHAVAAIKKFGYQTIGMPGGHSRVVAEVMRMHRGYHHILCPGGATEAIFREGFDAAPHQMLHMGLPRLDLLWDSEDSREKVRARFQIPEDREILLYVPTFRKGSPVDLRQLLPSVDPKRFVLVIRLHPLESPPDPAAARTPEDLQIIIDHSLSTEEWLRASDRIITDYSALGVEAALTGKPVYYYVYDISEYERATGLNVDPRIEMPRATAVTGSQLAELLSGEYDHDELRRFRDRFITIDTDACTARLGDFIHGIVEEVPQTVSDASPEAEGPGA